MINLTLVIAGAVIVLIFILPVFEQVFNFGTVAGCLIGSAVILLGVFQNKLPRNDNSLWLPLVIAEITAITALLIWIYIKGCGKAHGQQAIIVLGCRVKGDKPSLALLKRVDAAYQFLLENPKSVAILSGGQGKDEYLSEALCMKQLLIARGIEKNRLFLEDESTSTDENIRFSKVILDELHLSEDVAVATSEYHQLRAKMICRRYGLNAFAQSSTTKLSLLPTFLLREVFALVRESLRK